MRSSVACFSRAWVESVPMSAIVPAARGDVSDSNGGL